MLRTLAAAAAFFLVATTAAGGAFAEDGDKLVSGMSIVGDHEAPKSLVIVPWKSAELGDVLAVSRDLDDARQPVDKDVFRRQLAYYQLRAEAQQTASDAK